MLVKNECASAIQVLEIGSGPSGKRLCVKDEKGRELLGMPMAPQGTRTEWLVVVNG